MEDSEHRPCFLVLDMRLVQGMDSSAASTFVKTAKLFGEGDAGLVIVPGSETVARSIEQAELTQEHFEHLHLFEQFDAAIEWCEEQVLADARKRLAPLGDEHQAQLFSATRKTGTDELGARLDTWLGYLGREFGDGDPA